MGNIALRIIVTATFAFLLAPIVMVVVSSFNGIGLFAFPPKELTTRWYHEISSSYYSALYVSLTVATISSLIACIVGTPAAIALARGHFLGREFLNTVCLSPLMVPALVTGVALFQYSLFFWDVFRLSIGGTILGLVIGHLTFAIPFVVRAVLSNHAHYDYSIEEAAESLGARPSVTFLNITLPILKSGIVSGGVFAFLISLDEVPIALFMGGGDATTLPVKIFTAIEISFGGDILAISSVIVGASIVVMLFLDWFIGLERLFMTKQS